MVAGHLREKSGYYYAVLNYTDSLGKRKTKWISTGLTVKGNKKRAEAILMDARRNFNPEEPKVMNGDILFADYIRRLLPAYFADHRRSAFHTEPFPAPPLSRSCL